MNGNMIVGQSGGPTAVINASVAGVFQAGKKLGIKKIYGMIHGIEGFLEERLVELHPYLDTKEGIALLKQTPSAFLGSCRYKMPKQEENREVYEKIFSLLDKYDIQWFFYIGGNDSMDTVKMLAQYAKEHKKKQRFIGIPKTIDNDLPITDHCPGYGSVAKYVATSIKEVIRDNESFGVKKPTICIVETMGRNAGWIVAAAALARGADCTGCDAIYMPERVFDVTAFLQKVKALAKTKSSVVIAVSEGVRVADGRYLSEIPNADAPVDAFGHIQNTGVAAYLAKLVQKETGLKTRTVEISSMQRAASHLASLTDVEEAYQVGFDAVLAARDGQSGVMIVLEVENREPYRALTRECDIAKIANVEKYIPDHWITEEGTYVTEEFVQYARPLIQGELPLIMEHGLPRHLRLKEI